MVVAVICYMHACARVCKKHEQIEAGTGFLLWWRCGVGFLCVGGLHMASVGRGSNDGKGRMRETEKRR